MVTAVVAVGLVLVTATPVPARPATNTPRNYGIFVYSTNGLDLGTTDLGIDCDDCTKEVALPFAVNVYGSNYTNAVVSSNGNIQFTTNNSAYSNTCLPNASMGVMVAPFWDDLTTAALPEHGVYAVTSGSAPNRKFALEWRARKLEGGAGVRFSLAFNETPAATSRTRPPNVIETPDIEIDYADPTDATTATVGVQRPDKGLYRQHSCNTGDLGNAELLITVAQPVADFDANGSTDVGVFRPSNGHWYLRNGQIVAWGANGDRPVPADYDGDGDSDTAVFRPTTGTWFIRNGSTVHFGTNGDIPVPGWYGLNSWRDRIVVFRPSTGTWFFHDGPAVQWGSNGDIPVPADYDGDGASDIAVFRPSTGTWFIGGLPTVHFGTNGDIPVPGDYNGDGVSEMAVFRPSNGYWFIKDGPAFQWGMNGDIPVPGHYVGDPWDVAVFRPGTGQWFVKDSAVVQFGTNGDIPLSKPRGSV